MAFVAVTSLMRTLELQFLHPHPRVPLTNKDQIKSLNEKLGHLLVFLEECEKKANIFSEMKEVTEKIREVCVEAEDDIEEELLNVHHYQKLDQTLQRVGQDIEELMKNTRNTNHLLIVNQLNHEVTVGGSSHQPTSSNVKDAAMVGRLEQLNEVKVKLLCNLHKPLQVVAMVGMGGIGKTTFVKTIYDDPKVKSHFDLYAWTTMSEEHDTSQALTELNQCILQKSNRKVEGGQQEQLRKRLLGQRYLIIVDNIWNTKAWDDIKQCFPNNDKGSRILLTTRDIKVAEYANSGEYCYKMSFLNPFEGWDLFYQKFLDKEFLKNEFEVIGRNVVKKCRGLPITIVVLAGLLSSINKSVAEWENVETKINSLLTANLDEQFSGILTLSYNNLPSHLKCCFLYLGVFHEYCDIPVKKLIRLWIAEGFVETMSGMRLEEVGEKYLQDLIGRSLLMVHGISFVGKIKSCRMHDLLRELCKRKAEIESLLFLETRGSSDYFYRSVSLDDNRWLCLKVGIPAFHLVIDSMKCRSILCFNLAVNCDREWYLIADSFKKLRVLDLNKINFKEGMPPDITDLVFLRYLSLASSKVLNHIPLWKNWNLQTLIVCEDDNGAHKLPHGIWDLPQLRHLEIYHQISIDLSKVVQENLQTLYWLSTSQCSMEVFLRIPNIKELGIIAGSEVSSQGLNNLCCLKHLEKLRVLGSYRPLLLPPLGNIFPQDLKELTFVKTLIPWEAMSIISMLPNLEVLKLKYFACVGQEWEIEEGSFPELKVLLISLTNLKEWKACVDSPFPKLKRLLLRNCSELKKMPAWIENINTLQSIMLEHCYKSLVSTAQEIKENHSMYGNDNFNVLDSNTRPDEDHADKDNNSDKRTCEDESVPHGLTSLWFEARKLSIAWGHDTRYWKWTLDLAGYQVAKLKKVSAFEIRFSFDIRCLCKMTCYSAYLVFKLKSSVPLFCPKVDTALAGVRYEKDKALYGWMRKQNWHTDDTFQPSMKAPTEMEIEHKEDSDMEMETVRVEGGNHNITTVHLAKTKSDGDCGQFPESRSDGWMEIKLGDFYVCSGNEGEVELQLRHTSNQFWKSGLVVRGIEIRPAN